MRLKILPYKIGSRSAKALADQLNVLRIRSPYYRQRRRELILNWGAANPTQLLSGDRVLNHPSEVERATNKLRALYHMRRGGVQVPDFSANIEDARAWINEGEKVFCRTLLNAHSGRGIVVARTVEELVPAPLYTRYTKKTEEYRVHVFGGRIIDASQKRLRNGLRDTDGYEPLIRNHANGWVFCREGTQLPECAAAQCVQAVSALRLDFGAVDVGVKDGVATVYEVNTAPGLEGTTLTRYVSAIRERMHRG